MIESSIVLKSDRTVAKQRAKQKTETSKVVFDVLDPLCASSRVSRLGKSPSE